MNISVNPSPGVRDHPEHGISALPFDGVVVVTFGDAVVASREKRSCCARRTTIPSSTSHSRTFISSC
jgi:uncharacterized protein (DUF427 family)